MLQLQQSVASHHSHIPCAEWPGFDQFISIFRSTFWCLQPCSQQGTPHQGMVMAHVPKPSHKNNYWSLFHLYKQRTISICLGNFFCSTVPVTDNTSGKFSSRFFTRSWRENWHPSESPRNYHNNQDAEAIRRSWGISNFNVDSCIQILNTSSNTMHFLLQGTL